MVAAVAAVAVAVVAAAVVAAVVEMVGVAAPEASTRLCPKRGGALWTASCTTAPSGGPASRSARAPGWCAGGA
jgi:hypothetical protein